MGAYTAKVVDGRVVHSNFRDSPGAVPSLAYALERLRADIRETSPGSMTGAGAKSQLPPRGDQNPQLELLDTIIDRVNDRAYEELTPRRSLCVSCGVSCPIPTEVEKILATYPPPIKIPEATVEAFGRMVKNVGLKAALSAIRVTATD